MQFMLVNLARQTYLTGNRVRQPPPNAPAEYNPELPPFAARIAAGLLVFRNSGCSLAATEGTTMRCSRALGLCVFLAVGQTAWAQTPTVRLGKPQVIGATQTSNYAPPADNMFP